MQRRKAILATVIGIAFCAASGPSLAAKPSYEFGSIPMSASVKRVPAGAKADKDCWNQDPGCTFFLPRDGITYSIDEDVISLKEMLASPDNAARLPYGLATTDTKDRAVAKVSIRLGVKFTCQPDTDNDKANPDGTLCFSGPLDPHTDETLGVNLRFTKGGRLHSVSLSQAGPSD